MSKFQAKARLLGVIALCLSGSGVMCQEEERRVLQATAPPYRDSLVMRHREGPVRFDVRVTPSGEVEEVTATEEASFPASLIELCAQHAREWRFEPAERATTEKIVFEFRLVPEDSPATKLGTVFVSPATMEIRDIGPPPGIWESVPIFWPKLPEPPPREQPPPKKP